MGFLLLGALTFSLCAADEAAAQQPPFTVNYTTTPEGIVTVDAVGNVQVLPRANAGIFTATISATAMTLINGTYFDFGHSTSRIITVRIFSGACSIAQGCPIFGITGGDLNARLAAFQNLDAATMRDFAFSGANVNERVGGGDPHHSLLYHLANVSTSPDSQPRAAQMSLLAAAGADPNGKDTGFFGNGMLHVAALNTGNRYPLEALLQVPGINLGLASTRLRRTPLDVAAREWAFTNNNAARKRRFAENAEAIRQAGGRCAVINTAACHASQVGSISNTATPPIMAMATRRESAPGEGIIIGITATTITTAIRINPAFNTHTRNNPVILARSAGMTVMDAAYAAFWIPAPAARE